MKKPLHLTHFFSSQGAPSFISKQFVLLCLILLAASLTLAQNDDKPRRKVVSTVEPRYPAVLQEGHFEGLVRLAATVSPSGNVSKVEVRGGNPMLCQYAAAAVMRWKYVPGPSQTVEEVVFNFHGQSR